MGTMTTPMRPPPLQNKLEGCETLQNTLYSHFTHQSQDFDWFDRLHYIYQHFQDREKKYQLDPKTESPVLDDDTLYPYINNQDSLTSTDKYTALLQQELQNPYWSLHDPVTTKSYQISKDMDIETMPHAMYFTGNTDTVTKINHILYQTIVYNENGMFTAKLMKDTPVEIFIDNGATLSILPLHTYNKFPIPHTYPKTESNTPIHTGGGLIKSHFWLEIPLKLDHQTIQIKALVCDSECPHDLI